MCTIMSAISTWFFHKVGMDIFYFINCFFVYSFLGWIFECIVISYEEKAPVNRGFIRGPFCTIYGVGALGTYFLFLPISHNKNCAFKGRNNTFVVKRFVVVIPPKLSKKSDHKFCN